jgi:hypothetical protein
MDFRYRRNLGNLAAKTEVSLVTAVGTGFHIFQYAVESPNTAPGTLKAKGQSFIIRSAQINTTAHAHLSEIEILEEGLAQTLLAANVGKAIHGSYRPAQFKKYGIGIGVVIVEVILPGCTLYACEQQNTQSDNPRFLHTMHFPTSRFVNNEQGKLIDFSELFFNLL